LWREPQACQKDGSYLSSATAPAGMFLCASTAVFFAAFPGLSLDLSLRVLEASIELEPFRGDAKVLLDNFDGVLNQGTPLAAQVGPGRRLSLSFGYQTPAGAETSDGTEFWV